MDQIFMVIALPHACPPQIEILKIIPYFSSHSFMFDQELAGEG
jgi:hypothetical protein